MEIIKKCDLCGHEHSTPLFSGQDNFFKEGGEFQLVTCDNCGLYYLNPRPDPEALSRFYPEDYISYYRAIEDEPSRLKRWERAYGLKKFTDRIRKRAGETGRILDIGAATGIFLNGMAQSGWEPFGVEPSSYAAAYARNRFGIMLYEGFLADANFRDNFFDVVTMWDVFEHVPNPTATLIEVRRILKPGGWLVLGLPNPDSWDRKWFGPFWAGWDIPRHFHIFSIEILKKYFEKTGFTFIEIESFSGRHGAFVLNIEFWMANTQMSDRTQRLLSRVLRSLPLRILTWPFFNLANKLNKNSTMTLFARKPGTLSDAP